MKNFKYILVFTLGAAVGSVVTWKILKTKYEEKLNEEIESVKETFSSKQTEKKTEAISEPVKTKEQRMSPTSYGQMTMNLGYTSSSDAVCDEKEISIIMPDEFGQFSDYKQMYLTYYADNVLAHDDDDGLLDDVENTIGSEFLDRFGEYEAGVVHVRNDALMTDFEISLDTRPYSAVVGDAPITVNNEHGK